MNRNILLKVAIVAVLAGLTTSSFAATVSGTSSSAGLGIDIIAPVIPRLALPNNKTVKPGGPIFGLCQQFGCGSVLAPKKAE